MTRPPDMLARPMFGSAASGMPVRAHLLERGERRQQAGAVVRADRRHVELRQPLRRPRPRSPPPASRRRRRRSSARRSAGSTRRARPRSASVSSSRSKNVSTMKRSAPRPSRICACSAKSSRRTRDVAGSPSGPTDPATQTSRPVTSRASRASFTAVELMRSTSSSRNCCASLRRLAPKVFVSISSAPPLMKLTCSETTAWGARRFASSGQRSRGTAAEMSAPMPPSATIGGPLRRRSTKPVATRPL